MAQDETYQTTTYHERGGDRYVIGSGGEFAVESGGSVAIYSGAQMTVESGAKFELAGQDLAGDDARRILASEMAGTVIIGQGATSTKLSVVNLPANVRVVILSGTSTMTAASFWLTSVSAGREVFLMFGGGSTSTASGAVTVSLSGCSLLGSIGTNISGFVMNMSASHCAVFLKAIEDNVWAIVSQYGDIDE